jgi:hypothetical protein
MRRRVTFSTRVSRHLGRLRQPVAKTQAVIALLTLMLLVAPMIGSCGTAAPAPTAPPPSETTPPSTPVPTGIPSVGAETPYPLEPPLPSQPYTNTVLGVALSYPHGWLLRDIEAGVVLGTSEQVIAGGKLTSGAGLTVSTEPLPNAEWESVEGLTASRASVFRSENMQIGEPHILSIDGQTGAQVELHGRPALSETPIRGMVTVVIRDQLAYTLVALSTVDEWPTYGATLQATLESIKWLAREEPTFPPDPWEPDDSLDTAATIEPGTPQSHDLHRRGDRDYVRFDAVRGHVYTVETANLGDDIDTRIFLHGCKGNLLTHNDDGLSREEPWASRLVWTARRTCTHYVMVRDVDDDSAGPGTSYDLRLREEAYFVEDEYEPDGSPRLATVLKPGEPQAHNLHIGGDVDWMRVDAKVGATYVIETYNLGPDVDTVLHLLDDEGNELAVDDDGRDEEEARSSRIRWTPRRDVSLYILVNDAGDDAQGPGTQYWVSLLETYP